MDALRDGPGRRVLRALLALGLWAASACAIVPRAFQDQRSPNAVSAAPWSGPVPPPPELRLPPEDYGRLLARVQAPSPWRAVVSEDEAVQKAYGEYLAAPETQRPDKGRGVGAALRRLVDRILAHLRDRQVVVQTESRQEEMIGEVTALEIQPGTETRLNRIARDLRDRYGVRMQFDPFLMYQNEVGGLFRYSKGILNIGFTDLEKVDLGFVAAHEVRHAQARLRSRNGDYSLLWASLASRDGTPVKKGDDYASGFNFDELAAFSLHTAMIANNMIGQLRTGGRDRMTRVRADVNYQYMDLHMGTALEMAQAVVDQAIVIRDLVRRVDGTWLFYEAENVFDSGASTFGVFNPAHPREAVVFATGRVGTVTWVPDDQEKLIQAMWMGEKVSYASVMDREARKDGTDVHIGDEFTRLSERVRAVAGPINQSVGSWSAPDSPLLRLIGAFRCRLENQVSVARRVVTEWGSVRQRLHRAATPAQLHEALSACGALKGSIKRYLREVPCREALLEPTGRADTPSVSLR